MLRIMLRRLTAAIAALFMLVILTFPMNAANNVTVKLNGATVTNEAVLVNGTTYVPLKHFIKAMGGCSLVWDPITSSAGVISDKLNLTVYSGRQYINANGRYLFRENASFIDNGTLYTPVSLLVQAFGATLTWDGASSTVNVTRGSGAIEYANYNTNDVYWLSRIIHAESNGESLMGKMAVGNVIQNRVRSSYFPNDIYSVIFDTRNGIQFTPVANGTIYNTPSEESKVAAQLCLEGYSISSNTIYFVNPAISKNSWIQNNCLYCFTLGRHDFYA